MATFSVASGVALLYDEGVVPFDPAKQVLAAASLAQDATLGSDGLAMRRTAIALAMEDNVGHGTTDVSPEAMYFLEEELAATPAGNSAKSQANEATLPSSGYPYSGWANNPDPVSVTSPASGVPSESSPAINVLA